MLCIHICISGPSLPFTIPDDTPGHTRSHWLTFPPIFYSHSVWSEEKASPYTVHHIHNTTTINMCTDTHTHKEVCLLDNHHKTCTSIIIKFWFHILKLWNILRDSPVSQVLCYTVSIQLTTNAIVSLMQ